MKKIVFILLFLVTSLNINSQIYSIPFGLGLGYSHVFGNLECAENFNPSRDLIEIDFNIYYLYVGIDAMTKSKEKYIDAFDPRYQYESGISTWGMKIGPYINVDLNKNSVSIIPYVGFIKVSDDWTIKRGYYYYDRYYGYDYYDYYSYYNRKTHSNEIFSKFIYGMKVLFNINNFSMGAHCSNMELGLNVGYNFKI